MDNKIKHLIRQVNLVYYAVFLVMVLVVTLFFIMTFAEINFPHIDELSNVGRNISTVYLVYLLVSIPFSLYGFSKKAKKWKDEEIDVMFEKYKKGSYQRIIIIGFALIIGVILVYLLESKSMIFSAAIAAVCLYFCKPTYRKIVKDLELTEE